MCINEHWSVRALTDRINSMLYERTAISKKTELTIVNDLKQLSEKNKMTIDFAFLGRQVRITVGNKDYYIDLLFYHRKLRRLVLIELKLGEFLPEHKGQVELYLRWLQKNKMNEGENPPIAIILCASKNEEEIELLEVDKSGIHVGQYLTLLPPKELFQEKLHKAIERAKESFGAKGLEE